MYMNHLCQFTVGSRYHGKVGTMVGEKQHTLFPTLCGENV
jgi:ribosomal protein L21E